MLWSLIKILVFVAVVILAATGLGMLLETSGEVRLSLANRELSLSPLRALILLGLLLFAFWLTLKVLGLLLATFHFLNGDETAVTRYFNRSREKKGYQALSDGMIALAAGEGSAAMAKAGQAEKYLNRPELTNLIAAQAAELTGDTKKAEDVYKRLLSDDKTRFVGVRGILKQKLAEGDTDMALKLAEKAFALKPRHSETQDVLLRLQAENEDWAGARQTLNSKLKTGSLPRAVHRRRDAVLAISEAREVAATGSSIEARETAIEANRLSPDLIPAAIMAAQSYMEQGKPKYATRVLKKAWETRPHPDLAACFATIVPDETPVARIKRFGALTGSQADHPETKMLLAELNIAAEDFPQARRSLGTLVEDMPNVRVLTIMAAIERGEGGSDTVVRGWLAKAVTAPRGPVWVCENCQNIHADWTPVCGNCGSFDTLSWREPARSEQNNTRGAEMLPLIIGPLDEAASPDAASEDADVIEGAAAPVGATSEGAK